MPSPALSSSALPFELAVLAWGCLLGLVHIFAAAHVKTRQYGLGWNMGARDAALPPPVPLAGRLMRAQANYFETFPIVAALLLADGLADLSGPLGRTGAALWLGARILYLPLYAAGVPVVRTIVWGVALLGIAFLLWPLLAASLGFF
jgi:uncharacterized MAPEG superfamily protein